MSEILSFAHGKGYNVLLIAALKEKSKLEMYLVLAFSPTTSSVKESSPAVNMKLAALILLLAIVGKISAHPLRVGYYRAIAPQQQHQQISSDEMDDEVPEDDDAETEVSEEDFTNDLQDDDDDDDDEQEPPPNFQKLFPVASPNQAGYNYPLSSMMGEIGSQAWRVPKKPANRGRAQLFRMDSEEDEEQADDDDDDDDDSDEEEDEEAEDDIPDWQALFPPINPSKGMAHLPMLLTNLLNPRLELSVPVSKDPELSTFQLANSNKAVLSMLPHHTNHNTKGDKLIKDST
ncbi:hypothetical protein Ocin01_03463 [Orchesella cincta]|uniref:Uncharacterized protein n=1 Tax=Orchesella cincta TaxID=48709 RepID=A0A1D2ND82_ORCCI|nr:hypothetical protein Ocin01_03463 [Orchesella cincta]